MTIGIFHTTISKAEAFLKLTKLFRKKGVKPIGEVSDEFKNMSIKGSYFDVYRTAIKNLDYDLLLVDESIFQFSFKKTGILNQPKVRLSFFQNPQEIIQYDEYLREEVKSTYDEAGDIFMEEYEQYVTESELNSNSTSIRYDLDFKGHKPLIHASSHLHIGNSENIRIPCSKLMTPLMFVIFVIKHIYYNNWKDLIDEHYLDFDKDFFSVAKNQCLSIPPDYWKIDPESKEFYLS